MIGLYGQVVPKTVGMPLSIFFPYFARLQFIFYFRSCCIMPAILLLCREFQGVVHRYFCSYNWHCCVPSYTHLHIHIPTHIDILSAYIF